MVGLGGCAFRLRRDSVAKRCLDPKPPPIRQADVPLADLLGPSPYHLGQPGAVGEILELLADHSEQVIQRAIVDARRPISSFPIKPRMPCEKSEEIAEQCVELRRDGGVILSLQSQQEAAGEHYTLLDRSRLKALPDRRRRLEQFDEVLVDVALCLVFELLIHWGGRLGGSRPATAEITAIGRRVSALTPHHGTAAPGLGAYPPTP